MQRRVKGGGWVCAWFGSRSAAAVRSQSSDRSASEHPSAQHTARSTQQAVSVLTHAVPRSYAARLHWTCVCMYVSMYLHFLSTAVRVLSLL